MGHPSREHRRKKQRRRKSRRLTRKMMEPLLNDTQSDVRRVAFEVLSRVNRELLVPHMDSVRNCVSDRNPELRQRAVVALSELALLAKQKPHLLPVRKSSL